MSIAINKTAATRGFKMPSLSGLALSKKPTYEKKAINNIKISSPATKPTVKTISLNPKKLIINPMIINNKAKIQRYLYRKVEN